MRYAIGWGVGLVLLGAWLWLSRLGVPGCNFGRDWPLLLVAFGVWRIVRSIVRAARRPHRRQAVLDDLENGRIDAETAIIRIKGGR